MSTRALPTKAGTYMRKAPGWETQGWTPTPNALIRNPLIDWDVKAAYTWIASHQELIFQLSAEDLAAAGPRGRNHAYEMLRALEFHGWLTRTRYRADDGRGTVHVWTLHPTAVPQKDRTWKPSNAKERNRKFPAADATATSADPAADGPPAPELPDGREFRDGGDVDGETAGQPGIPDGAGVPGSEVPGNPDRSETDRSGFPYMEEKNRTEEQGGDSPGYVTSDASPADDAPPSSLPLKADWRRPETWYCREHLAAIVADPGFDVPCCAPCGRVKDWGVAKQAEVAEAERVAAERRAGECSWHDVAGWVIDPETREPIEPAVPCDCTTPPEVVKARLAARKPAERPARTRPYEEFRAMAKCKPPTPRPKRGGAGRGSVELSGSGEAASDDSPPNSIASTTKAESVDA